jgi:hypothetical protein
MMQVAVYEVVGVVAVRNRFMAAFRTMLVAFGMPSTIVLRRAMGRIRTRNREAMFFDAISPNVMKVSIVEVIDVALMLYRRVSAAGAVLVVVTGVQRLSSAHAPLSFCSIGGQQNR